MKVWEVWELESQVPGNERIVRIYHALEGDWRIVTEDGKGRERRYTVRYDMDGKPVLFRM